MTTEINVNDIKIGSWVRFYRDNQLVIGQVEYMQRNRVFGNPTIQTDQGTVDARYILEVRNVGSG